jgi:anhydro-N-acetylmuramic acid kinase
MTKLFSIGLMSGTSMDGIDAALIITNGEFGIEEIANSTIDYKREFHLLLKAAEYTVRKFEGNLEQAELNFSENLINYLKDIYKKNDVSEELARLSDYLRIKEISLNDIISHSTELHAEAIKLLLEKSGYNYKNIDLIGYHGQTLYHNPGKKLTIQVGDGQLLANLTGIKVINNFRENDVLNGGQGAPLAPLYHQALAIRDNKYPLAVINCGGIANVTVISGAKHQDIIGFDTGPGNGLIDQYIRLKTNGREQMDIDGKYGSQGKVNEQIMRELYEKAVALSHSSLEDRSSWCLTPGSPYNICMRSCIISFSKLLRKLENLISRMTTSRAPRLKAASHSGINDYLTAPPPKSLDIGNLVLIPEINELNIEDACRTLEAFTADTIVKNIAQIKLAEPKYYILAGGGWYNPVIKEEFEQRLLAHKPDSIVLTADEFGWNSKALEAQIFAYLAVRSYKQLPITYPNITGALAPLSGGSCFLPISY